MKVHNVAIVLVAVVLAALCIMAYESATDEDGDASILGEWEAAHIDGVSDADGFYELEEGEDPVMLSIDTVDSGVFTGTLHGKELMGTYLDGMLISWYDTSDERIVIRGYLVDGAIHAMVMVTGEELNISYVVFTRDGTYGERIDDLDFEETAWICSEANSYFDGTVESIMTYSSYQSLYVDDNVGNVFMGRMQQTAYDLTPWLLDTWGVLVPNGDDTGYIGWMVDSHGYWWDLSVTSDWTNVVATLLWQSLMEDGSLGQVSVIQREYFADGMGLVTSDNIPNMKGLSWDQTDASYIYDTGRTTHPQDTNCGVYVINQYGKAIRGYIYDDSNRVTFEGKITEARDGHYHILAMTDEGEVYQMLLDEEMKLTVWRQLDTDNGKAISIVGFALTKSDLKGKWYLVSEVRIDGDGREVISVEDETGERRSMDVVYADNNMVYGQYLGYDFVGVYFLNLIVVSMETEDNEKISITMTIIDDVVYGVSKSNLGEPYISMFTMTSDGTAPADEPEVANILGILGATSYHAIVDGKTVSTVDEEGQYIQVLYQYGPLMTGKIVLAENDGFLHELNFFGSVIPSTQQTVRGAIYTSDGAFWNLFYKTTIGTIEIYNTTEDIDGIDITKVRFGGSAESDYTDIRGYSWKSDGTTTLVSDEMTESEDDYEFTILSQVGDLVQGTVKHGNVYGKMVGHYIPTTQTGANYLRFNVQFSMGYDSVEGMLLLSENLYGGNLVTISNDANQGEVIKADCDRVNYETLDLTGIWYFVGGYGVDEYDQFIVYDEPQYGYDVTLEHIEGNLYYGEYNGIRQVCIYTAGEMIITSEFELYGMHGKATLSFLVYNTDTLISREAYSYYDDDGNLLGTRAFSCYFTKSASLVNIDYGDYTTEGWPCFGLARITPELYNRGEEEIGMNLEITEQKGAAVIGKAVAKAGTLYFKGVFIPKYPLIECTVFEMLDMLGIVWAVRISDNAAYAVSEEKGKTNLYIEEATYSTNGEPVEPIRLPTLGDTTWTAKSITKMSPDGVLDHTGDGLFLQFDFQGGNLLRGTSGTYFGYENFVGCLYPSYLHHGLICMDGKMMYEDDMLTLKAWFNAAFDTMYLAGFSSTSGAIYAEFALYDEQYIVGEWRIVAGIGVDNEDSYVSLSGQTTPSITVKGVDDTLVYGTFRGDTMTGTYVQGILNIHYSNDNNHISVTGELIDDELHVWYQDYSEGSIESYIMILSKDPKAHMDPAELEEIIVDVRGSWNLVTGYSVMDGMPHNLMSYGMNQMISITGQTGGVIVGTMEQSEGLTTAQVTFKGSMLTNGAEDGYHTFFIVDDRAHYWKLFISEDMNAVFMRSIMTSVLSGQEGNLTAVERIFVSHGAPKVNTGLMLENTNWITTSATQIDSDGVTSVADFDLSLAFDNTKYSGVINGTAILNGEACDAVAYSTYINNKYVFNASLESVGDTFGYGWITSDMSKMVYVNSHKGDDGKDYTVVLVLEQV